MEISKEKDPMYVVIAEKKDILLKIVLSQGNHLRSQNRKCALNVVELAIFLENVHF